MGLRFFSIWILATTLAACGGGGGGDDGSGDDGGGDDGGDPDAAAALVCSDFAYCSTYSVIEYEGVPPQPAGGTIPDGVYRLAWSVEDDPDTENGQDYAEAYLFAGGQFISRFARGRVSKSGTTLTLTDEQYCSLGTPGDPATTSITYPYSVDGDRLMLFSEVTDGTTTWRKMYVYVRTDAPCTTVANDPATPGDSYACRVINCVCRAAQGNTVESCS